MNEMMMMEDEEMMMDDGGGEPPKPYSNPHRVHDYDFFVIGGGSGGLASAKKAAELGAKVAMADYVKPTPAGTSWGLGGTCVNVGCIPKKLMHFAGLMGEMRKDQIECGWNLGDSPSHDWPKMVANVQKYIKDLNWGYKVQILSKEIDYYNSYASFVDPHTIKLVDKNGKVQTKTAENILIAVGGRPNYPDFPGATEFGITSDDIFSLPKAPGKTLIVGASYVALECAGFINAVGFDTTVMVRSILLRGFDQDMAERIGSYMEKHGVKFKRGVLPHKITKTEGDKKLVEYEIDGETKQEEFDTVLFAIGRTPTTGGLNLEAAGVHVLPSGKFKVKEDESTNVPHIFAIGDVRLEALELTPLAIQAGNLLSRRLFNKETIMTDYTNVPTTVFTPLEYGCVGLTEDEAKEKHGETNISVYHTSFKPLEWVFNKSRADNDCYVKVIVNKSDNLRVVGFHILSPNAGEITQGVAIAIKCGVTKDILDATIGIHPTVAEEVVGLTATKEDNPDAKKTGC